MKKNKNRQKTLITSSIIALLALTGYLLSGKPDARVDSRKAAVRNTASRGAYDYNDILVMRVVDGDTLKLESGEYVRLLGIDTPEYHESAKLHRDSMRSGRSTEEIRRDGKKAYEFTRHLAEGRRVRLEFDTERYDKYNRLLAYVFLEDGTFLNGRIVEDGYASITHYRLNVKYADEFLKLYRQARENKRGLWANR
jgi:micrococcal nuclease